MELVVAKIKTVELVFVWRILSDRRVCRGSHLIYVEWHYAYWESSVTLRHSQKKKLESVALARGLQPWTSHNLHSLLGPQLPRTTEAILSTHRFARFPSPRIFRISQRRFRTLCHSGEIFRKSVRRVLPQHMLDH